MPSGVYKRTIPSHSKGVPKSDETKRKISESKKGKPTWNKGIPSPWTSLRNKLTNPLRRGNKHPRWKGGTYGTERHRLMSRSEYKEWRSAVFERDNWTCQTCGARGVYLEAHHIKRWSQCPDLRYDIDNGVTLCSPCHKLTFKDK